MVPGAGRDLRQFVGGKGRGLVEHTERQPVDPGEGRVPAEQDRLEPVSIRRMRWPRNIRGFDVTPTLLRSPMSFLAHYLVVAPSVAKSTGLQAIETLGLVEAARDAQEKLRRMGRTMDERAMPRGTDATGRELDVARVGAGQLRKGQTSWKQLLAEARRHGVNL